MFIFPPTAPPPALCPKGGQTSRPPCCDFYNKLSIQWKNLPWEFNYRSVSKSVTFFVESRRFFIFTEARQWTTNPPPPETPESSSKVTDRISQSRSALPPTFILCALLPFSPMRAINPFSVTFVQILYEEVKDVPFPSIRVTHCNSLYLSTILRTECFGLCFTQIVRFCTWKHFEEIWLMQELRFSQRGGWRRNILNVTPWQLVNTTFRRRVKPSSSRYSSPRTIVYSS
jgi:hypothetical protein